MENLKILNFSFKKISIEKYKEDFKELKIQNKLDIISITPIKNSLLKIKEDLLNVKFSYILDYNPEIAKLEIEGNLFIAVNPKDYKSILKDWENQKLDDQLKFSLFNFIFKKVNIKALNLEEELGLPFHIPFPSIKSLSKEK
ncbi:hypothetical protein GYA25_02935 [Candidatus Woesearchaeota archaeon]|jgi:hypothetical protein|nr:hypothetical protein [Candidatus Woesearchaeota archaeon]